MKNLLYKVGFFFKQMFSEKISYDKKGINPVSDWSVILFSSVISMLVLIGISVFFYFEINKGNFFKVDDLTKESEIKINSILLKKVVGDLTDRQVKFNEIKSGKSIPADPSL